MSDQRDTPSLAPHLAERLGELARSCKAAARAISLYPPTHPAIETTLERMEAASARATDAGALTLSVLPEMLKIDGRQPQRPEAAIVELAGLLHSHQVGELRVQPGVGRDTWSAFLTLVGQSPEELRAQGGLARVWSAMARTQLGVSEIDYGELLAERASGSAAAWDSIANCLQGESVDLDDRTMKQLLEVAGDPERLSSLFSVLEERAAREGLRTQLLVIRRLLRQLFLYTSASCPERVEPLLQALATASARLSPETLLELVTTREAGVEENDITAELLKRIDGRTVSYLFVHAIVSGHGARARLAEAFQSLVPDAQERRLLLGEARERVGLPPEEGNELWRRAEEMIVSYSDRQYVSEAYGQQLTLAKQRATEVEQTSDDPPERIAAWLGTVSSPAMRNLDLRLLLDLLVVETDVGRWKEVAEVVISQATELALLGDFESAGRLVQALLHVTETHEVEALRKMAAEALDRLLQGPLLQHIVLHMDGVDDEGFEHALQLCRALGAPVPRKLAEALAVEDRGRARVRLRDLLVGFGAVGRESIEQLKTSPNPGVRRTAILLLRQFGEAEALPELESLLDDAEPHVQREAVRAILQIGSEAAYAVLLRALSRGSHRSTRAITSMVMALRDERAVPLFCYIIRNNSHRGALRDVYMRSIDALGEIGGWEAVEELSAALRRGDWWAPFRTAAMRSAVAAALNRIGTDEATAVLQEAADDPCRGVRSAARARLAAASGTSREAHRRGA
jgi:hypothetical protein